MIRSHISALALALAAAGCGIPLSEFDLGPVNQCTASSDCALGAVCAPVDGVNACVATEADLPGLILEIRPDASSALGANVSYLIDVAEQGLALQDAVASGQVRGFDPQLPALAQVDGKLYLPVGAPSCDVPVPDDRSFPAHAVFRRVDRFYGLPPAEYTANAVTEADGAGNFVGYAFHADLPKGTYDIYVVPEVPVGCVDGPLPFFLAQTEIVGGTNSLNIEATPKRRFWGTLHVPGSMNVDGWSLELVEPRYGGLISETQSLEKVNGEYLFDVDYDWTDHEKFTPLVRLRPPEGAAQPTLHWDLEVVSLMSPEGDVQLSLSDLDTVRHVEGQVLDSAGEPVVATVQIQSVKIAGDQSSNGNYRLEADTDEAGVFAADLPPGRYRVVARPVDLTKAVASKEIEFPADTECFCGQSIIVPDMGVLRGVVSGPAGESMDPAYVVASPSSLGPADYFGQFISLQPPQPREAPTQLFGGAFELPVDPGTFDFAVRPADGSGYPWLVRPRLYVPPSDTPAVLDLDPMTVPYPAVLQGVIRDPSGAALPSAVVRAWLPVSDTAGDGEPIGVIQIGATLGRSDGSYILPLPPSLSE